MQYLVNLRRDFTTEYTEPDSIRFFFRVFSVLNRAFSTIYFVNYLSLRFQRGSIYLSFYALSIFIVIPVWAAPRIQCETPIYDFGTVIDQDKITHEFILKNVGDEAVRISTIKNCCGVESVIHPLEIHPGSNAVCKSVFTTRKRYGPQDKQILIASNDRKHPYFELKMMGTLLRPVDFSPRLIRLGNMLSDTEMIQTITATNLVDQPVVLKSVYSTIPGIRAERVGDGSDSPRSWIIQLTRMEDLSAGEIRGQIRLNFSTGVERILVIGSVKPILQATPKALQLPNASTETVERFVMIRSGDNRPFDVLSAELINAEGFVESTQLSKGQWKVTVRLSPDSVHSGSKIKLETSCPQQPVIELPISMQSL